MKDRLTLPEALVTGRMAEFARRNPIDQHPDGDARFEATLAAMLGRPANRTASAPAHSGDCSGTRILSRTSAGAGEKRERASRESRSSDAPKTLKRN